MNNGECQICGFRGKVEKHHLVPRVKCHSSKYGKNLKTDRENVAFLCRQCHDQIHAMFSNNDLRDGYRTIRDLLGNERFAEYVQWRKKHLGYDFSGTKMSNKRKRR